MGLSDMHRYGGQSGFRHVYSVRPTNPTGLEPFWKERKRLPLHVNTEDAAIQTVFWSRDRTSFTIYNFCRNFLVALLISRGTRCSLNTCFSQERQKILVICRPCIAIIIGIGREDGKEWDTRVDLQRLLEYNCWDCVRQFEVATSQMPLLESFGLQDQWVEQLEIQQLALEMMNRENQNRRRGAGAICSLPSSRDGRHGGVVAEDRTAEGNQRECQDIVV